MFATRTALYLLDTNIASIAVRGDDPVLSQTLASVADGCVAVSVLVEAELLYGLARRPDARALARAVHGFLQRTVVLSWGRDAAVAYGELRAMLRSRGTPLSAIDTLIAAHALVTGAVLVTRDKAFRQVPGLQVQDWA